ncbi:MAG: phenylalanine--tRNA ligase subunit beta [Gemmatales bacterium]|nr:phenylalanine--tRNA ligase subunit beta [Gemmatales bacterium]MDW8385688.1 phenylalanine--tRNA ligase subunit beta [Gemmatales bacterium]
MKVPLRWLSDYVEIPIPAAKLVERLTLAGLEVAGVRLVGVPAPEGLVVRDDAPRPVWDRDKVLIAEVLEVKKHPDADRLLLVTVNYGKQPHQMVTGATNLKVGDKGQKVVVALSGAVLLDGYANPPVLKQLKPTKIRGILSDAMVCSARELGISDEHEGIIILENDAPVGMPLVDFMGDIVLDIDVLPNMARCLSLIGVAREVAALTGGTLKAPPTRSFAVSTEPFAEVAIEDPRLCPRYSATLIRNVAIGPSPGWMQRRLTLAGMRPINNVVDITNYVMLEWGQPLHAFDHDLLVQRASKGKPRIEVRPARAGEKLVTLDGQTRQLTPEHLVIADTRGPIALAGVMGGADTEVTASTRNVLLEAASFDFVSIRRTARAFDLPSEASLRFSRGVHPDLVSSAALRAAELFAQLAGGQVVGSVESYPAPLPPQVVTLPLSEIRRSLGIELPVVEVKRILHALEFTVEEAGSGSLRVTTPPHRLDIQHGVADLIEELVRIHGYDQLPATLLREQLPRQRTNWPLVLEERVRDILATCGLQEVMNYSLTTVEREAPLVGPGVEYVRLANPVTVERSVMRRSVLASVLESAASNLRHVQGLRLFEIGFVYLPRAGEKLPEEPRRLAIVMTGPRQPEFWDSPTKPPLLDFFDLKGVVEALLAELHVPSAEFRPAQATWLHPGRSAEVRITDDLIGCFGQLHPGLNEHFGLGRRDVLVAEFDLELLLAKVPRRHAIQPIPEFPPIRQDIAVVLDEAVPAARVEAEIRAGGGELLRDVKLFDVYRGPNLPEGKKSLAFALTFQALDRTLTDKDAAKVQQKIVGRLERLLGARLRA